VNERMPEGFAAEPAVRRGIGLALVDVLALYKLAVISEGIYARFQMGKTLGPGFENMQRATGALAERALALANASSDARLRGRS
jgi:hypothetical protein